MATGQGQLAQALFAAVALRVVLACGFAPAKLQSKAGQRRPTGDEVDETTPAGQLLTGDQNLVNVQVVLDYTVQDDEIEDYIVNAEHADAAIARAAEAVIAEWLAGRAVDEVLIEGKAELPNILARRVKALLRPYHLGVRVQGASVSYLFPPDEVKPAQPSAPRGQAAPRVDGVRATDIRSASASMVSIASR